MVPGDRKGCVHRAAWWEAQTHMRQGARTDPKENGSRKTILARDDGGLNQGICREKRGILSYSVYVMKTEPTGFADGLYVAKEGKRGI